MTKPDPVSRNNQLPDSHQSIKPSVEVSPQFKKTTDKHTTTVYSIPEPKSKVNKMGVPYGTSATSLDPYRFIRSQAPSSEDFRTRRESHHEHLYSNVGSYAYSGFRNGVAIIIL